VTHIVAEDIGGCKEELSQLNERRRGIGSKGNCSKVKKEYQL
jgi:hypothetical protein